MSPRASIFDAGSGSADTEPLDLADFSPGRASRAPVRPDPTLLRSVSEAQNFPSREPPERQSEEPPRLRRRRTGRNAQINIKATRETIDALYRISDREGWVLGETLEHALKALEAELQKNPSA